MKTNFKQQLLRIVSAWLALTLITQYAFPVAAFALTSGPGQPEFSSFEPVGTSDMVDLYSGDFTYNIPLLSVPGPNGGYPINLAYHSGPGVDEEASWVGLGWNINVGAINRQLRGLPDDFNGDQVTERSHLKPNTTVAMNMTSKINELFGIEQPSSANPASSPVWQVYYNNYKGLGYRVSLGVINSQQAKGFGMDLSFDSQNGVGVEPDFTIGKQFGKYKTQSTIGAGYNSRQGLEEGSFSTSTTKKSVKHAAAYGMSSGFSFSTQFNVPSVQMPMRTNTFPYSIHVNPTTGALNIGLMKAQFSESFRGYVTESAVANNGTVTSNAYGYLYNLNGTAPTSLRDFQRENIEYTKKVPNLAPSSFTYDNFSQSGQGSGSQFRSYANNVGVLTDREVVNEDYSYPINIEYGSVPTQTFTHFGAGFSYNAGSNQSGAWQTVGNNSDVLFSLYLNYEGITKPGYQSSPFKVFGEKTGILNSEDHLASWGGDEAVKVKLGKSSDPNWIKRQYVAQNLFVKDEADNSGFTAGINQKYRNQDRERRATNVEYVTDADFWNFGFTRNIGYSTSGGYQTNVSKTTLGGAKSNHISEITTVQPDGMRYVYGIPAYNNVQYDGSFAVNTGGLSDFNTKTVSIPHGAGSWQVDYNGTYDEFDQQTELGPYVHSWLLSAVVSADYLDIGGDGPSQDDYGYWVRFNYEKNANPYHWHVPYEGANYYEGKKGDPTDDRASYSCGNRDEYYLQSVETKTHIAVFYMSEREDGIAAANDLDGGLPSTITSDDRLMKVDSIKLYTKAEYYTDVTSRALRTNPVAIKTVHFSYTYELCGKPASSSYYGQFETNNTGASVDEFGNSPASGSNPNINANKGKLTLKKVWFTYQTSERGEFSPYLFEYGSGASGSDDNPYYDPTAVDRWGNYKKIDDYQASGNKYPYVDHPYTDQESTQSLNEQEPVAGTWSLKKITLPSGARIEVNYEVDDYAYVEDQKAMRMFDIYDLGRVPNTSYNDEREATSVTHVTAETGDELSDGQYRVYFRLNEAYPAGSLTAGNLSDTIKKYYLDNGNLEKIYFKSYMDLLNHQYNKEKDYVSGYADIEYNDDHSGSPAAPACGMASTSTCAAGYYDLGYITLLGENINTPVNVPPLKISPFIKAALQHLHFNRSELVHTPVPYSTSVPSQIANLVGSVSTNMADIAQAMVGFNAWAYAKGYGKEMDLNGRSVIRLYEPDGRKYGGGSRVSKITINDNWDNDPTNTVSGVDPDNYTYGIEYNYDITENGRTISSGVCYEPRIGGEESALHQPISYVHSTPLHSSENLFLETPLLENYYPGAMVGYRKVTATSIAPEQADLDDNGSADQSNILKHDAAPISIYEFYSPKEFPIVFDQTDINADPAIIRPIIIPGIYTSFTKRKARSQGYSLVLNDMAGKPRSVTQRTKPSANNPNGTLISKMEYIYNTEQPFSDHSKNKLCSKVQVLLNDGSFQTASVGQSHDIFIDMNENLQTSIGGGLEANADVQAIPSVLVPSFFPTINKRELSMRTVVVNKIIYRTGIIKEVIATHEASTIKTESVAFDIETGDPLLTKTTNEFGDPIYQYTYPGHWFYDGVKGGYINQGVVVDRWVTVSGIPTQLSPIPTYTDGRISGIDSYLDGMDPSDYFTPGDEVWVEFSVGGPSAARYHVIKVGPNYIDLVDLGGNFIASGETIESIRIIRSGHDNMQSVAVGSLTAQTSNVPQYDPQDASTNKTSNTSYSISNILQAHAIELYDIMRIDCTPSCNMDNVQLGYIVDPYAIGTRGIWRPYASYAFSESRTQSDNIRSDGAYTAFVPFYWAHPDLADSRWITASIMTKYSPHGFELENKDANGIYSAALYEFSKTLNTAVASNAQYKEIAYESFEDLGSPSFCDIHSDHWGFSASTYSSNITTTTAHTGVRSIKLTDGQSVSLTSDVTSDGCEASNADARLPDPNLNLYAASSEHTLNTCDCNGVFEPNADKKYLLMAWVKQTPVGGSSVNTLSAFTSPTISVDYFNGVASTTLATAIASGPVIDGWQRIYFEFTIPSNAVTITVTLENNSGIISDDYFDDIRIQPYDANMMTYVYDPMTYRLVAQLDANNFASYFLYDEQGGLEKMKVETEQGIKTVKEGRMNMDKH